MIKKNYIPYILQRKYILLKLRKRQIYKIKFGINLMTFSTRDKCVSNARSCMYMIEAHMKERLASLGHPVYDLIYKLAISNVELMRKLSETMQR